MSKQYNLNQQPALLPDAMASATRMGRMDALAMVKKPTSIRAVSDRIALGCANGFATALKQAYNAGYWSASI